MLPIILGEDLVRQIKFIALTENWPVRESYVQGNEEIREEIVPKIVRGHKLHRIVAVCHSVHRQAEIERKIPRRIKADINNRTRSHLRRERGHRSLLRPPVEL